MSRRERGVILIAALLVVSALALLVGALVENQRAEVRVAEAFQRQARARQAALSGIHRAMADLAADETAWDGPADAWRGGATVSTYQELPIGPDGEDGWVSLVRYDVDSDVPPVAPAYGLEDENGKVNLNTAAKEVLAALPGMTSEIAAAVVDWRDPDEQPDPEGGAESDYYLGLASPYRAKNAPFGTVDELGLVRGVTPALLHGEDSNRNGLLDPNEDDGDDSEPPDNGDGVLDRGLAPFVTVWSLERNVDQAGEARLNLNQATVEQLRTRCGDVLQPPDIQGILQLRTTRGGQFATTADILDVPSVTPEEYKAVCDRLTLSTEPEIEGLVNVNTAPREVLRALPGMDDDTVDQVLARRTLPDAKLDSIGWLLEVESLRNEPFYVRFRGLSAIATVRSGQVSAVAAGGVRGTPTVARIQAILDRREAPPKIVYLRDLTGLGVPFAPPAAEGETE